MYLCLCTHTHTNTHICWVYVCVCACEFPRRDIKEFLFGLHCFLFDSCLLFSGRWCQTALSYWRIQTICIVADILTGFAFLAPRGPLITFSQQILQINSVISSENSFQNKNFILLFTTLFPPRKSNTHTKFQLPICVKCIHVVRKIFWGHIFYHQ